MVSKVKKQNNNHNKYEFTYVMFKNKSSAVLSGGATINKKLLAL